MTAGILALLGSGETAPGMTKVHRSLLNHLGDVRAVNLNTPYGFQENVPQMTEKLLEYFSTSLQVNVRSLDLRSFEDASSEDRAAFKAATASASYVFAGPGSPSYAVRQWLPLDLTPDLVNVLANDGVLCFASAAALTLGAFTPPIYEVYKAGALLAWLQGLDLMAAVGVPCVVLPHYNNAEGANYDTSRCYLGERRLRVLEEQLPEGLGVLGIDEHTAAVLDFAAGTLTVKGKGEAHWRLDGAVSSFAADSVIPLVDLGATLTPLAPLPATDDTSTPVDVDALLARLHQEEQLVATLEAIRNDARGQGLYAIADQLRAAITAFGVTVSDAALPPTS